MEMFFVIDLMLLNREISEEIGEEISGRSNGGYELHIMDFIRSRTENLLGTTFRARKQLG